jgi:hypothetical protein
MAIRGQRKHCVKKQPSKAISYNKVEGTLKEIMDEVKKGAKLEQVNLWNKVEYWIRYPQGGYHRISKRIYDAINKL